MRIINWCNENQGFISVLSVVLTSLLTGYIIFQTSKLNKKQQELESQINDSQVELHQKQLKLDLYEYRREVYRNLLKVIGFCNWMDMGFEYGAYSRMTPEDIALFYNDAVDKELGDPEMVSSILLEAKYLYPKNISDAILKIKADYDAIRADFCAPNALKKIHADNLEQLIKQKLEDAKAGIEHVRKEEIFIATLIDYELNIADLEK